jgi:hypothetical protein
MGKKSPAPPPAPDYAAIARQQGAANVEAARTSAYMSNPNVYTPYGSQTVTWSRTPNFDEAGYQKALEAWQSGGMYGEDGSRSTAMPTREQFTTYIEQPTVRQEVPYWSQTAINNELQAQARLAMAANEASARLGELPIAQQFTGAGIPGITYSGAGVRPIEAHLNLMGYGTPVSQVTPLATPEAARVVGQASGGPAPEQLQALNLSGVAPVQAAPTGGQFGMAAGGPAGGLFGMASGGPGGLQLGGLDTSGIGGVARGPEQGQFGAAQRFVQGPELQRQIDLEGIAQGPINAGTTAQQAIMSRLSPQLQGERQQLYTQLINQGLRPGGEAFNAAMSAQMQKENDLLLQAAAQGISLDQAARQQAFAEQQSRAMFANQAALQGFGAGMEQAGLFNVGAQQDLQAALATQAAQNQAQQQAFQQRLQAGEFGQEAQLASFGTQQSAADAYNRAIAQNFAQAQAAQQMGNQAIGQNFEQALAAQQAANAAQAQQFGQAVGAGEFDRQRLLAQFGMGQGAAEAYNQALAQNQAAQIAVQQANLARQQQNFGQQMSQAELANAALQQQRQAAIDQNAFYNQALQQMYNQEMGQSQFYNTAVQQALAQQAAIRSLPINEISALLSGGQVNVPQFQGYSGVTVAPAPIFQAGQAAGDFAQRNYQNQVGAYNAQMGLLGQLGGAAGTALGGSGPLATKFAGLFSDRRLKSNIVRVGTHPLGIGIYEYDIFGERQRGVMADEVQAVLPEAVTTHESGYQMVNYGML